jgi:hypothetical protein
MKDLITSKQLCNLMGWTESSLRQKRYLISRGAKDSNELPEIAFKEGRMIFYLLKEVKKWKRSLTTKKHVS